MNNWVDQTWSSNPTQGSLTHYFNEMSGNKLHFIGKEVHTIAPHTRDWYLTNYYGRGNIQKEIIQQLDATWDFAEFDNWDYVADYTYNSVPDTYVEMIIFVWRNIATDRSDPDDLSNLGFYSNYGDLGGIGDISVDNNQRKVATWFGGENSTPYGSGVSVRNYLTEDPFRNSIHEFSHYLIGGNNYHNGFGFWGMLSAWGIRSYVANAYERYRLGWVADSTTYTVSNSTQTLTGRTLSDFVTGKNAYRLVINTSPQEYFFIENHQKTSYWENSTPFFSGLPGIVENGMFVLKKVGAPSTTDRYWLQLIPADGRYNWQVNQSYNPWGTGYLPVFKQLGPNKESGYSDNQWIDFNYGSLLSPQPIHLTENSSGQPQIDVRFQGDGKDAFMMDYNQVFSPWSNPNNQRAANQTTSFGFEITNFSSGVYTLNIYVNTSQNASPSKPQNLQLSANIGDEVVITWNANTEPDMQNGGKYKIFRSEVWGTGDPTYWDLIATINAYDGSTPVTTWTDTDAQIYTGPRWLHYKIVAVDNTNLESVPSQVAKINARVPKESITQNNLDKDNIFYLRQNNPNPFNPSTKITYRLPKVSYVVLKVFDILGREVAELVNSIKAEGDHTVQFNTRKILGKNRALTSGLYIYTIKTDNYFASKKMLLTK